MLQIGSVTQITCPLHGFRVIVNFVLHKGSLIPPPSQFLDDTETPQNTPIAFPNPPAAPKVRSENTSTFRLPFNLLTSHLLPIIAPEVNKHDKYSFYWKPYLPIKKMSTWTFKCDELRHQIQPELIEVSVHFPPEVIDEKTALEIILTAKNLPQPVKYALPIEIEYITEDASEYAYSVIDDIKL